MSKSQSDIVLQAGGYIGTANVGQNHAGIHQIPKAVAVVNKLYKENPEMFDINTEMDTIQIAKQIEDWPELEELYNLLGKHRPHSNAAEDTEVKKYILAIYDFRQSVLDPENQPSQYGTSLEDGNSIPPIPNGWELKMVLQKKLPPLSEGCPNPEDYPVIRINEFSESWKKLTYREQILEALKCI